VNWSASSPVSGSVTMVADEEGHGSIEVAGPQRRAEPGVRLARGRRGGVGPEIDQRADEHELLDECRRRDRQPDQDAAALGDADRRHRSAGRLDDGPDARVIAGAVPSAQRVGTPRAPRVNRDDPELLAEVLQDRLEDLEAIDNRVHEEQRLRAAAVLVERQAGAVAKREPGPMKLVG
jgi:hypothetical protein